MPTTLVRPLEAVALTGLFLPAAVTQTPREVPLPNAPLLNPALRLPTGGLTLLYGNSAPMIMGQALQRAQAQRWRCIAARVIARFVRFPRTRAALSSAELPQTEILYLNKIYCSTEVAGQIQAHLLGYLAAAGQPAAPDTPSRFTQVREHPELLGRLLEEAAFRHLKAVVFTLPGLASAPGQYRLPAAQYLYLRDLTAIDHFQVDFGAPPGEPVFRLPTREDLAQPRTGFNPFAAEFTPPKPGSAVGPHL